jgi:hypothetical protein
MVWLGISIIIVIFGLFNTTLTPVSYFITKWQAAQDSALSVQYQRTHPTLACKIFPQADAERIAAGTAVSLINSSVEHLPPHSGIIEETKEFRHSSCDYSAKDGSYFSLVAEVREAFSPAAQQKMYEALASDSPYPTKQSRTAVTFQGYSGYYDTFTWVEGSPDIVNYTMDLWVKGFVLSASSQNFETTNQIMKLLLLNFDKELAARADAKVEAEQRKIPPVPVTGQNLSDEDKAQITAVVTMRKMLPPGTTYDIAFDTIAGTRVKGSIRYDNGIRATFTADKQNGGWLIREYR